MGSRSASKKAARAGKTAKTAKVAKLPKKKCCVDTPKCNRCPLRMLQEGTLPPGYTVKKRKLVKVGADLGAVKSGKSGKSGKKSKAA